MDFLENGLLVHCNTIHELWQYIINPVTNWEGRHFITEIEHTACDTLILYTVINGEKIECCTIYPHVNTGWFTLVFGSGFVCPEIWRNIQYCRDPFHSTIFTKPSALANILSMAIKNYKEENKKDMTHGKLYDIRNLLLDRGYKIKSYWNPDGKNHDHWLSLNYPSGCGLMLEVFSVYPDKDSSVLDERFIVVDYYSPMSGTYSSADDVVKYIERAYEKYIRNNKESKAPPEKDCSYDIESGTIDPSHLRIVTGRRNGKTLFMQNLLKNVFGFEIKDVIFNDPATIVFWEDGEKTVVQCQNGEEFDPEKGLAMAISKRVYGNKHTYYEIFKKWIGKYKKKKFQKALAEAMKITPDEITHNGHRYVLADNGEKVIANLTLSEVSLSPEDAKAVLKLDGESETKNPREGISFQEYLAEQMKDPEFKKQYENTEIINEEDDNK